MSFARWSTVLEDGHESDLYVFEDVAGRFTVHVAGSRRRGVESAPRADHASPDFVAQYRARRAWFDANDTMDPIGLPFDGQSLSFDLDDVDGMIAKFRELAALGYRFPPRLLDPETYR